MATVVVAVRITVVGMRVRSRATVPKVSLVTGISTIRCMLLVRSWYYCYAPYVQVLKVGIRYAVYLHLSDVVLLVIGFSCTLLCAVVLIYSIGFICAVI